MRLIALTLGVCLAGCGEELPDIVLGAHVPDSDAGALELDDGRSVLTVDRVRLAFTAIFLEDDPGTCDEVRAERTVNPDQNGEDDWRERRDRDRRRSEDGCMVFDRNVLVFDLPLDGTRTEQVDERPELASYRELQLEMGPLEFPPVEDEDDAERQATYSELEGSAVEVSGRFNGRAFENRVPLEALVALPLRPLELLEEEWLVVSVDVTSWFIDDTDQIVAPGAVDYASVVPASLSVLQAEQVAALPIGERPDDRPEQTPPPQQNPVEQIWDWVRRWLGV